MRTLTLQVLTFALLVARSGYGAGGQIEMSKHRFSRHGAQNFERLVLEFKGHSGDGLPGVRVGTDGAAGEVTVQVLDVTVRGAIPEADINDRFVPKSKLLGPIAVNADGPSGFTLRTFLKDPQARIDAFWLDNPVRLVVDAFGKGANRNAAIARGGKRSVAGSKPRRRNGYACFPSGASVGMKVSFQGDGRTTGTIAVPVDAGKAEVADEGVVCYPKNSELNASISFETPSEPTASNEETPEQEAMAFVPKPVVKRPSAPANSLHKKSQQLSLESTKSLTLPSSGSKPALLPPPAGGQAPMLGLSLPTAPAAKPAEPARTLTDDGSKPSLNLPISLPALPQGPAAGAEPPTLALPPQGANQPLLPPLAK